MTRPDDLISDVLFSRHRSTIESRGRALLALRKDFSSSTTSNILTDIIYPQLQRLLDFLRLIYVFFDADTMIDRL